MKHLKIYTDGGARGNPGPAAFGVVVKNTEGEKIHQHGEKIGKATNNQAEYEGLLAGLRWLCDNKPEAEIIDFYLDSNLIVNQMQGNFKVKSINIRPLWRRAQDLVKEIPSKINFHHIPREKNTEADSLLNQALDR